MEEKSKTVKMEPAKGQEKLSYEQLEQVAGNLNKQCQQLYNQLREAQAIIDNFNEVEMLLSILGKSEHFDSAFTERCANEIQEIITRALDNSKKIAEKSEKN